MTTAMIEHEYEDGTENGRQEPHATTALATTRQAREVQAAMIVAKRFPRDEDAAVARIIKACKRPGLAELSQYEYTRGGTKIVGPSIRLAETMAQAWGNLDFGIIELERRDGESQAMAYCWDLETNTRQTKIFTVRHVRDTKQGGKALREERDIYELVANMGARRVRNCILGIIPQDVKDAAIVQCNKTMEGGSGEPIEDRVRRMLVAFGELGVTQAMIETKLNHKVSAISPNQLAQLQRVYGSIKDGVATREEHFNVVAASEPGSRVRKSDLGAPKQEAKKDEQPFETQPGPTDWLTEAVAAMDTATNDKAVDSIYDAGCGPESNLDDAGREVLAKARDRNKARLAKGKGKQQQLV